MGVQLMVYVYLAVCASMILFNCACIIQFKKKDQESSYRDNKVKNEVRKQIELIEKGGSVSKEHIDWLAKKSRRVGNFASMDEELDRLSEDHREAVDEYIRQIPRVFIQLAFSINKKDSIQQAHYAYMLKKYGILTNYPTSSLSEAMLSLVSSSNLYCRENALEAIYSSGNADLVCDALLKLSDSGYFHHEKLISEGLMSFKGDRKFLMDLLIADFEKFNTDMQNNILGFIRFGKGRYDEFFFDILKDDSRDDELRFSALRYFARYKYDPAYDYIIYWAENPQLQRWEYASIAVSALATYPCERSVEALKGALSNSNWYIRKNAAENIGRLNLPYAELAEIYDGRDRYAREILQYEDELKNIREEAKAQKGNS